MPKPELEYIDELYKFELDKRHIYGLPFDNLRPFLDTFLRFQSLESIVEVLDNHKNKIRLLDHASNYSYPNGEKYVCNDWVFNKIGIPEFTTPYVNKDDVPKLNEFLRNVSSPQEGDVALYFNLTLDFRQISKHFGLVKDVEPNSIIIDSKWDIGHVYRHRLEAIPQRYGRLVSFYRKK